MGNRPDGTSQTRGDGRSPLTPAHLRALAVLAALGHPHTEISRRLAAGVRTPRLGQLSPISFSAEAVGRRLRECDETRALVREARHSLFSDVYDSPLAYAGHRMRSLERVLEELGSQLRETQAAQEEQEGGPAKARATLRAERREIGAQIRDTLRDAGRLVRDCDPEGEVTRTIPARGASGGVVGAPGGTVTLRARGRLTAAALGDLARDLAAATAGGLVRLPDPGQDQLETAAQPAQPAQPAPAELSADLPSCGELAREMRHDPDNQPPAPTRQPAALADLDDATLGPALDV